VVSIEPLLPEQFELVAEWLSKPEINQWLTAEWRNRMVDALFLAMVTRNRRNRLFLTRHHGQACGLAGLADIDLTDKTAMVWYILGEQSLSGRGIMSEAVMQLTELCFGELRLESVYAWIIDGNAASRRVLEKAGFHEAGRIRRAASIGGRQVDRIYFDVLPDDRRFTAERS